MVIALPLIFLKFWFFEAPKGLIAFFGSCNRVFLQLFSLPLLIKTFFRPWKNEYREGLVGFSIGMGMFIKTFVILVDTLLLVFLLIFELAVVIGFIGLPVMAVLLLIY